MEKILKITKCPCCGSTRLYEPSLELLENTELKSGEVKYIRCHGCGQIIKVKYETFPDYEIVDTCGDYFDKYCNNKTKEAIEYYGLKDQKIETTEAFLELISRVNAELKAENEKYGTHCFYSDIRKKIANAYLALLKLQKIYCFGDDEINYEMAIEIDKAKREIEREISLNAYYADEEDIERLNEEREL